MTRTESTRSGSGGVRGQSRIDRQAVGQRIAQARTDVAGLTQKQLASAVGVTGRAVQSWEAGARAPVRHLRQLEEALGVSREWLLWGTDEPPASELAHLAERVSFLEDAVDRLTTTLDAAIQRLGASGVDVGDLREQLPPFRG
jgi:transcriptional regulator with XRE-family HTH domain